MDIVKVSEDGLLLEIREVKTLEKMKNIVFSTDSAKKPSARY